MRNLNFRAWDKHRNQMGVVDIIDFEDSCIHYSNIDGSDDGFISFDDCEIMQSTGYKDDNGAIIFEGDIIDVTDEDDNEYRLQVYWKNYATALLINLPTGEHDMINFGWSMDYVCKAKVIGNIYENPELLERKE